MSNVIDGIKINLIERCQFKVVKGNKCIRTVCTFNKGTTRKREKTQLDPVFIYSADCTIVNLILYADSFTIRYKMKF